MAEASHSAQFPTTQWSRIIAAGDRAAPEARAALAELCEAYWYPIYALIRRRGHRPEESCDLAQDYFTRLLEKGVIAAADQSKGRFRAFLRTDCQHFLIDDPSEVDEEIRWLFEAIRSGSGAPVRFPPRSRIK